MKGWDKENHQQKHQFKGKEYCANRQQSKTCGRLEEQKKYCCACYQELLKELEQDRLLISSAQQTLNDYHCQAAEKPRVNYINSDGSGWTSCEGCKKIIWGAGHHRIIKNRNDPKFWGVRSKFKILCLRCIGKKYYKRLVDWQRKKFREYVRRGYV